MNADTIAGLALVVSCISAMISMLAYRHTRRAFRTSYSPLLKLTNFSTNTGSYTNEAAEQRIGTVIYFKFQNLSDSVSIADIALSAQVARSRRGLRFWDWRWISLDSYQHDKPVLPLHEFKYSCKLIEVSLANKLPDVLQEKRTPHRHYQVLKSHPLRLRLKIRYRPGMTGAKHLSSVLEYRLHPECKSANGHLDELTSWHLQEVN